MDVELGPHQIQAIRELSPGKILRGGVGSGKSRVSLAFFIVKECGGGIKFNGRGNVKDMVDPKPLYIITTAKKRDSLEWEKEAASFGLSRDPESSRQGVKVTVDSWNNISNYIGVKDAFFIFDEQRLVGSGAWVKAFYKIARGNSWIILSATPGDTWLDYIPVFVANGFYRNKTEFNRRHVVYNAYAKFPKVDRFVDEEVLRGHRKRVLVDMPYRRHTRRVVRQLVCDYDRSLFQRVLKDRWHVYKERPIKDVGELFRVMRMVVNTDPDRIDRVEHLLNTHPKMIIFYNFNYELDLLRKFGDERKEKDKQFTYAEWNGQKHEEVPDTESWLYLVQYTAGAEGWNCVSTDAMVFYSLTYSYKQFEQAQGRIDRMNTPFTDLHYYVFRSQSYIDGAIMKALSRKENFNQKSAGQKLDQKA